MIPIFTLCLLFVIIFILLHPIDSETGKRLTMKNRLELRFPIILIGLLLLPTFCLMEMLDTEYIVIREDITIIDVKLEPQPKIEKENTWLENYIQNAQEEMRREEERRIKEFEEDKERRKNMSLCPYNHIKSLVFKQKLCAIWSDS